MIRTWSTEYRAELNAETSLRKCGGSFFAGHWEQGRHAVLAGALVTHSLHVLLVKSCIFCAQFMNIALWAWLTMALGFLVYLCVQKLIDVSPFTIILMHLGPMISMPIWRSSSPLWVHMSGVDISGPEQCSWRKPAPKGGNPLQN